MISSRSLLLFFAVALGVAGAPGAFAQEHRTCTASETLSQPSLYEVGDGPTHSTTGDFNGDRRLDLAYANFCDHQIAILLGDGRGGVRSPRHVDVGYLPAAIASGHFNADARLDLAVANSGDHDVSILLGNGKGDFLPTGRTYAVGNSPRGLATGDFDADGDVDLAVANLGFSPFPLGCQNKPDPTHPPVVSDLSEHRVAVLMGDGQGGFAGSPGQEASFVDAGPNPGRIGAADLDQDGDLDLALTNISVGTVSILTGDGSGGFIRSGALEVGANPLDIAVHDLNADGLPDLAAADNASDTVSVILAEGGGRFAPRTAYKLAGTRDIAVADLNRDGLVDLAVTHGSFVGLMLGKGGGRFGDANDTDGSFADVHVGGNGGSEPVVAGDFDRDKAPDLAIGLAAHDFFGDDWVAIHLNACRPRPPG